MRSAAPSRATGNVSNTADSGDDFKHSLPVLKHIFKHRSVDGSLDKPTKAVDVASLVALSRNERKFSTRCANTSDTPPTELRRRSESEEVPRDLLKFATTIGAAAHEYAEGSRCQSSFVLPKSGDIKKLDHVEEQLIKYQLELHELINQGVDVSAERFQKLCDELVALDAEAFEYACQRIVGAMELFEQTNKTLEWVASVTDSQNGARHPRTVPLTPTEERSRNKQSGSNLGKLYEDAVCVAKGCLAGVCAALSSFLTDHAEIKKER